MREKFYSSKLELYYFLYRWFNTDIAENEYHDNRNNDENNEENNNENNNRNNDENDDENAKSNDITKNIDFHDCNEYENINKDIRNRKYDWKDQFNFSMKLLNEIDHSFLN